MSKRVGQTAINVKTEADAIAALEEMEEIGERIKEDMARQVELKKAATAFAVSKRLDVLQLDGAYYRQINRATRFWVAADSDMPTPKPKGAKSLREICDGKVAQVRGREMSLWNFITKRVPDPEKISKAVDEGFVKQSEIDKAFLEKPQAPFLQRFAGEAVDE
jgi:hypothetical protein